MPRPSFLQSLSPEERRELVASGRARRWQAGGPVVRRGEPAESAVLLLEGSVKIHTTTAEGSEVVLGFSGPGELLGEISAVRDTVRGANATAMTPVEGVSVSVSALRAFLTRHPRATVALLDLVLARLLVADVRRMEFASSESLGRVASRLVELAERFGSAASTGAIDIGLPFPPGGAGVVELVVARVDEPRAANRRPAAVRAGARLAGGRDRRWTERLRPPRRCSSPSPIFPSATVTSPSPYSTASTG